MSSATSSLEKQKGNGRLKLKIKFSRSKGFVSDFVNEAGSDVRKHLRTTAKEPAPETERASSSQIAQISTPACRGEQRPSSQHVDSSSIWKKSNTQDRPADEHQGSSTDSTNSSVELHHFSDSTRLSPEINDQQHIVCDESTTDQPVCARTESKQADLPGVNYGKMLQDLEFLSAQQDEHNGRDASSVCGPKERHLTLGSSVTPSQKPTVMEPGCEMEGKAGTADAQAREEASDGEPMSPFDINCSLGFADADEDFSFTVPTQNRSQKQNSNKEMKENPLFPWSVDVCTKSSTHGAPVVSLLNSSNQPGSGGKVVHAGTTADVQCHLEDQFVKTSVEQSRGRGFVPMDGTHPEADRGKQTTVISFQNRGGSTLDSEINNNSHDSNSVFGTGPYFHRGAVHIPPSVALASAAAAQPRDSMVHRSLYPVGDSIDTSGAGAVFDKDRSLTRTCLSNSVADSQHKQSSVRDRDFSGLASPQVLQRLSSVLCRKQPVNSTVAERTSQTSVTSHPSSPPHVPGKDSADEDIESDFVIKLLSDEGTAPKAPHSAGSPAGETCSSSVMEETMKQLAENPPSVEPLLTPETSHPARTTQTQAVAPSPGSDTASPASTSNPLNRTIDELRKRVAERVEPDEAGASTESTPVSLYHSSRHDSIFAKKNEVCRCAKQDLGILSKSHENVTDGKDLKEKFCRRCGKRIKSKRKKENVWCRCNSPDPYLPDGTIFELCRKCMRRVSKQWRKRTAAKWCKCHTPVYCSYTAESVPGENELHKFFVCKRCGKWISKEREDVSMKGDQFGVIPGENVLLPAGLQSLMTDHNYCQSFASPNAQPKLPIPPTTPGGLQTTQRQLPTVLQITPTLQSLLPPVGAGAAAAAKPSKTIVYVFPQGAVLNSSGRSQKGLSAAASSAGDGSDLLKVPTVLSTSAASTATSGLPSPANSSLSGCISSSSGSLQNSSATVTTSCGDYPRLRFALSQGTGVTTRREVSSVDSRRKSRPVTCPAWLQGVSRDLLQPCYVVLKELAVGPAGPCSVSCRQSALNGICRQGDLQQCGHSLQCENASDEDCGDAHCLSDLHRKREYFRKNKTMVGFEEARQEEKFERQKESVACDVSAPRFHPLSYEHQPGVMNLRITSENGISIQRMPENVTPHSLHNLQQHKSHLQGTLDVTTEDTSAALSVSASIVPVRTKGKTNGVKRNPSQFPHSTHSRAKKLNQTAVNSDGKSTWSRKSRFRVKYYVFGAQERAFIVPLIQNKRHTNTVVQLDEEDMGYIREAINELLMENNTCARHLAYPDSLQHKGSAEVAGQTASKKTFVAPTLGGEDLDIEALKSLISDRDFSRLVPRNTRISKSRYLQEIGEKVHMYLTGGCEESPEWIKDVAKSIVMKHRKTVKGKAKKPRLRPSKNISIEIDYAEEDETLEVDDEAMLSPSHSSLMDGDLSTTGSSNTLGETETTDQCDNHDQGLLSDANHTSNPTGSFVVAEAFAQEEKKPLLGNLTDALQQSSACVLDGNVLPAAGQQILVPLPESCGSGQPPEAEPTSQSMSPSPFLQQHAATSVSEEQPEHKPLLGELLAASLMPGSAVRTDFNDDQGHHEQVQEQQSAVTAPPSPPPHQFPSWPLVCVKEEPPEEDYSHAWLNHGQQEVGQSSSQQDRERFDTIPFISNSTFGREAVQIDDEEGSAAPSVDHLSCSAPAVHSVIKMEQPDGDSSDTLSVPLVTCVAPGGELGVAWSHPHHVEASDVKGNVPRILSVTSAETGIGDSGMVAHGVISSMAEVAASCQDQAAVGQMPLGVPYPSEKKRTAEFETLSDSLTFGEFIGKSVEKHMSKVLQDTEAEKPCEETPEAGGVLRISVVASGEAARLWEAGHDGLSADNLEILEPSGSSSWEPPQVLPVITSVMCGEAVLHEEGDIACLLHHESELANGQQTDLPEDENEGYYEDFHDDDDDEDDGYFEEDDNESDMQLVIAGQGQVDESDLKSIITGEGQILAIPMILPSGSSLSETTEQQALSVPQIGVDLSIVKQEPQEGIDFSVAFMNDSPCISHNVVVPECSITQPNHQLADVNPVGEELLSFPSILEVRSLADIVLPSDREEETKDQLEASEELDSQSAAQTLFLPADFPEESKDVSEASDKLENQSTAELLLVPAEFPEHPKSPSCSSPKNGSSPSESVVLDVTSDASKITEAEIDEDIEHLADVIREGLNKDNTSCLKSASSKVSSKRKSRKLPGKNKRQQRVKVRSVVKDLPDSVQDPNKTENVSPCENSASDVTQSVDSFAPRSSSAVDEANYPVRKADVMEHDHKSLSSDLDLAPPSPTALDITSETPPVTVSDVISSHRQSTGEDILDRNSVRSVSDTPARESCPATKSSSPNGDLVPVVNLTKPAKHEPLKLCSDKLKANSGLGLAISSKSGHLNSVLAEETVPSPSDSPLNKGDSQPVDRVEGPKPDRAPVPCKSAAKITHLLTSEETTPKVNSVSAIENALDVVAATSCSDKENSSKGLSTDCVETEKSGPVVAETLQEGNTLPLVQENTAESRCGPPLKSPQQDSVGSELHQLSDLRERQTTLSNSTHPHQEKGTLSERCKSTSLETDNSSEHSQLADSVEANGALSKGVGSGRSKTKSGKCKKRGVSQSKGSKSRKMAVCGLTSSPSSAKSSVNTTDGHSQVTVSTPERAVRCNDDPSSQTVSDKKEDTPVLMLKTNRSPLSKCLSEGRVSSSCDTPVISQNSDLSADCEGVQKTSSVLPDTVRNDREKKSLDLSSKLPSEPGPGSVHPAVQDSSKEAQPGASSPTGSGCVDESEHYVSQICEGRGEQGRTCLVLRKKRPAQSSPTSLLSGVQTRESSIIGDVQQQQEEFSVPPKKLKEDVSASKPLLPKMNNTTNEKPSVSKGLKRKSDDSEADSHKSSKSSKNERSIFSDFSAMMNSLSASRPESSSSSSSSAAAAAAAAAGTSRSCPQAGSVGTKTASEAVTKVTEKGFSKNLFSRLQASLVVSVKDGVTARTEGEPDSKALSTVSEAPTQGGRERSFFDCLPQSLLDAWKNK